MYCLSIRMVSLTIWDDALQTKELRRAIAPAYRLSALGAASACGMLCHQRNAAYSDIIRREKLLYR